MQKKNAVHVGRPWYASFSRKARKKHRNRLRRNVFKYLFKLLEYLYILARVVDVFLEILRK